jgi:hypothetical protein
MEAIEVQLRTRFAYLTNRYCATKTWRFWNKI